MALSDADAARLASLKAARDKLISGTKVAKVSYDGREVDYSAGDLNRLDGEISALEVQSNCGPRRRGAIRFII